MRGMASRVPADLIAIIEFLRHPHSRPGEFGNKIPSTWRCSRCDRGFLRCQKQSLVSSRAPAVFAGERDLSETFLGPTEIIGPRNDNCADLPTLGLQRG